ncbi:MAG: cytochrome-c peroxidase, partial [Ferruginibacter sp.]|nr:cytochrome-c peroxidase [Ferruginibacter sp.]
MVVRFSIALISFIAGTSFLIGRADSPSALIFRKDSIPFATPKGWPAAHSNIISKNKFTEEGFQLGKKLFYDERLSLNMEISCGSCHQQFASFSHYDHNFSHGINNTLTNRNAPALINLA